MLLLDNIVYEIQKSGGVSLVWSAILDACISSNDLSFKLLDSGMGKSNLFYPTSLPDDAIVKDELPLIFRRYRDVNFSTNISLFHSSYFRVHNSLKVKNIVTVHDFVYEKFDKGKLK